MPHKIKQEDGTEIETFTQEEIDQKLEEVKNQVKEEAQGETNEKISEYEKQLSELKQGKEELEQKMTELEGQGQGENKGGEESSNFKTLKQALSKKDEEIEDLRKKTEEISSQRVNDYKEKLVDKYAGDDDDLRKKIEHNFDSTLAGVEAKSEKEIEDKVKNAVKLSIDSQTVNPLDTAMNGHSPAPSGAMNPQGGSDDVEFTQNEKELARKMGISEEEMNKYKGKLKQSTQD